ncbi:MAG: hypothetical protein H0X38_05175 [Planctomycetes bacterium]|nr:hypothetical protein [Planctomycetota bacterium]
MRSFTDTLGRTWTVTITVATVKRVRALCDVDLLAVAGGDLLERLATDPVLLADVLYAVVEDEAKQRQLSDVDFGRALVGDTIARATSALLETIVDFFPNPKRGVLRTALGKLNDLEAAALRLARERLEALDPQTLLTAALPPGAASGSSPASSAAIPAP